MIVTQSIHGSNAKYIDPIGDHLIWVFISSRAAYGNTDPKTTDGESIKRPVLQMIENWHPVLRNLITTSDSNSISAVPVLTSIPVKSWESTKVTLLGDAIHTMTPLQGLGGSSALRDAGLLCRELVELRRGNRAPLTAIMRYENAVINYGFAAVRRSAWFANIVVSDSRLLRGALKIALRLVTRAPLLKRRLFRI
jgi:2-polyprenyl-6-methoxyphenol hydroxylase-like FAD-dependent oxidoreductase